MPEQTQLRNLQGLVSNQFDDNTKRFCLFKAYDTEKSEFGGLHALSIPFLHYVTQIKMFLLPIFLYFARGPALENTFSPN